MGILYSNQSNTNSLEEPNQSELKLRKYESELQSLLNRFEFETGKRFEITLTEFGGHTPFVIGDFHDRDLRVEVYDVDSGFEQLIDTYRDIKKLEKHICCLRAKEFFSECKEWKDPNDGKKYVIGKCKFCNSYNDDRTDGECPNVISSDGSMCRTLKCTAKYNSTKWDRITVQKKSGVILDMSNNSKIIAYYKFV
jgi:hypothetical protein